MEDLSLMRYEAPKFLWTRGRRCTVVQEPVETIRAEPFPPNPEVAEANEIPAKLANVERYVRTHQESDYRARRPPEVLVCVGEGEEYEPLMDAPRAYLDFAAIGSKGPEPGGGERRAWVRRLVSAWPDIEKASVGFVELYGLPRPGSLGWESDVGLPLFYFYLEARQVAATVDVLNATSRAEREGDFSAFPRLYPRTSIGMHRVKKQAELLLRAKLHLVEQLNVHLQGVRLAPFIDSALPTRRWAGLIRVLPQYTCDTLLTAMWLQVYIAATERRIVRAHCKGCGDPFEAKDTRQEYCGLSCRKAKNQRDYYRSRGKGHEKAG